MKFEVINKNGQVVMWTTSASCVPALNELNAMSLSGYHYKIDGKIVTNANIHKAVDGNKSAASVVSDISEQATINNKSKYCVNRLF